MTTAEPAQPQLPPQTQTANTPARREELGRRLNAATWGLFFIWGGIAVLADLGWSWSMFGLGVIIIGQQVARSRFGLSINPVWAALGGVFLVGGLWEVFHFNWPLAPVMLILVGLGILWKALIGRGD